MQGDEAGNSGCDAEKRFALSLRGVGHRFGVRPVFEGVDLEVRAGQVGVIAGSNGSGKSTLLRIVAGLISPTQGEVKLCREGRSLELIHRRRYLGYVAPDLALYKELTGVENLIFFAKLRGIDPSRDLLRRSLERVGLLGRGGDLVGDYSSGMRQRLKYAFALLGDPPILLLDEPTANLDARGAEMVEGLITEQRARPGGGMVLIGTNEPHEERWGDITLRLTAAS